MQIYVVIIFGDFLVPGALGGDEISYVRIKIKISKIKDLHKSTSTYVAIPTPRIGRGIRVRGAPRVQITTYQGYK